MNSQMDGTPKSAGAIVTSRRASRWKALFRFFGIEVMSRSTWEHAHRSMMLNEFMARSQIDVLALLIDIEFRSRTPFFVQVGANDGIRDDQISAFVRQGRWTGILIEPQPDVFEQLKRNYGEFRQLIFENVAVSTSKEELKLYKFVVEQNGARTPSAFTTADKSRLQSASKRFGWSYPIEEIKVPTATIQGLLEKHRVEQCDMVIIDTEGMDYDVIQTIDMSRNRPSIIQFEHIHLPESKLQRCFEHLGSHGYRFISVQRDVIAYLPPPQHRTGPSPGLS
jgi:FkbM family methyltransferase